MSFLTGPNKTANKSGQLENYGLFNRGQLGQMHVVSLYHFSDVRFGVEIMSDEIAEEK